MKFKTYVIISILLILTGCNPNNPTPNPPTQNPVQTSWTMTVDNKTYSWTDTYHEVDGYWYPEHNETNPGCCVWNASGGSVINGSVIYLGTGNLPGFTEELLTCHLEFYPMNTGSWNISGNSWQSGVSNPSGFYLEIFDYPSINSFGTNNVTWNMITGNDNIALNITEFSTSVGGMVKGNFNGTYYDSNNIAHTVSGQFNAIRTE
jgi:hypothetical protein